MLSMNYFDFEYFESSQARFDIILQNGKRPHRLFSKGPRPYYLEKIDTFERLWNTLCTNRNGKITISQLHNFQALLISKIKEWNLKNVEDLSNENFIKLVEDSIINILGIKRRMKDDPSENGDFELIKQTILSGLFFDWFELFMTIMKRKIGDEK